MLKSPYLVYPGDSIIVDGHEKIVEGVKNESNLRWYRIVFIDKTYISVGFHEKVEVV